MNLFFDFRLICKSIETSEDAPKLKINIRARTGLPKWTKLRPKWLVTYPGSSPTGLDVVCELSYVVYRVSSWFSPMLRVFLSRFSGTRDSTGLLAPFKSATLGGSNICVSFVFFLIFPLQETLKDNARCYHVFPSARISVFFTSFIKIHMFYARGTLRNVKCVLIDLPQSYVFVIYHGLGYRWQRTQSFSCFSLSF